MSFCTTSRWYAGVEAPPIAAAIAPLLADVEAPPIADVEAPPIADVEAPAIRFAADCIPPAQNSPPRSSEWTLTAGTSLTQPDARSGWNPLHDASESQEWRGVSNNRANSTLPCVFNTSFTAFVAMNRP